MSRQEQDLRPYNEDRLRLARRMRIANTHGWDPWVDANDDYAVLEWMRSRVMEGKEYTEKEWWQWCGFVHAMHNVSGDVPFHYSPQTAYHVGDYARAALTVLGGTEWAGR